MEHTVFVFGTRTIAECLPNTGMLTDENSALDLVSICGEEGTDLLLLYHSNLHPDFFDLKTRLAGNVLLKLSNYRIHAAAVIPTELIGSGHFYEFVLETNRRNDFRVFPERDEAIRWLESL
jgi:PadR family transcriptional regulator, regulatory protein AphA